MNSDVITTLITVIIPSVVTLIGCMVNNNVQRTKENAAIELKMQAINDNYDKSTALIEQKIANLSDDMKQYKDLNERMYKVEHATSRLEELLDDIKDDKK